MTTEFIIGTVVTAVFGLPTLIEFIKGSPPRLVLVVDELINLYADITTNINDLEVIYKGEKVKENLFLVRAYIFYFGNKDILKEQISKSLFIEIQKDSKWKDCQIISKTDDLDIEVMQDESKLVFAFDILKNEDFFCFQSLCELRGRNLAIEDVFNAKHRIANIGKVQYLNYKTDTNSVYRVIGMWLSTILVVFASYNLILSIGNYDYDNFKRNYFIRNKAFNIDSIRAPLALKYDSLNTAFYKDDKALKSKNYLNYYWKLSNSIDSLDEFVSIRKNTPNKSFKYTNGNYTKVGDSLFKDFKSKYNYLYFIKANHSEPIRINELVTMHYSLADNSPIYISILSLLFILFMIIVSTIVTRDFLKYRFIFTEMNKIKNNR